MDGALVLQLVISGLAIGATYGFIGLGFSLVFGVLKVVNFAHGEFYMLGAFVIYTLTNETGIPYVLSVPLTALLVAALSWLLSAVFIERLVKTNEVAMLIGTLGLSYVMLELAQIIWGPNPLQTTVPWQGSTIGLPGGARVPLHMVLTALVALAVTALIVLLVKRSAYGRYMRAVAENPAAAGLCGINVRRVYRGTFAVGCGVAALAGGTAGALTSTYTTVGQVIILKAFVVVIVAGLGNISGAIVAGLLLGVVETLGGGLLTPEYQDAFGYAMLVLVLLLRPSGLGKAQAGASGGRFV